MNEELKNRFAVLDINTKRNQISNELLIVGELIKNFELSLGLEPLTTIKNYDSQKDSQITEGEMLTFLFEDIYNIKQELTTLLTILNKNKQ